MCTWISMAAMPRTTSPKRQACSARKLSLPAGYTLSWSGQYEAFRRINLRLLQVVPLTLLLIAVLLYWNTRSVAKTGLVLLAVPFSAIGAVWSLYLLGYPMSPAVWVGLIALLGVDAETGTFMVLYLDLAWQKAVPKAACGRPRICARPSSRARRAASGPSS